MLLTADFSMFFFFKFQLLMVRAMKETLKASHVSVADEMRFLMLIWRIFVKAFASLLTASQCNNKEINE